MLPELRFLRKFGAGAFGEVYEEQSKNIAVKIADREQNPKAAPALKKEALALQACKRAKVPHVVDLIDYYTSQICDLDPRGRLQGIKSPELPSPEDHKCDALILPILEGGSLEDKLDRGPLSETECKQIAKTILEALVGLHENAHIVHRDLKPANIMFQNGEVVLIDFGVSSTNNRPTTPTGTPYYMAPEVWDATKRRPYTSKADLWSLGILVYQSLVGKMPFEAHNRMQLYMRIDQHLCYPEHLRFPASISPVAREFILELLKPATHRPSAAEALSHPWLQKPLKAPIHLPALRRWRL
ncbi:MAG: serine/threonine-protein kinase [Myxococcaceae bacterium]